MPSGRRSPPKRRQPGADVLISARHPLWRARAAVRLRRHARGEHDQRSRPTPRSHVACTPRSAASPCRRSRTYPPPLQGRHPSCPLARGAMAFTNLKHGGNLIALKEGLSLRPTRNPSRHWTTDRSKPSSPWLVSSSIDPGRTIMASTSCPPGRPTRSAPPAPAQPSTSRSTKRGRYTSEIAAHTTSQARSGERCCVKE